VIRHAKLFVVAVLSGKSKGLTDADFIELYRSVGPTEIHKRTGISLRNVIGRRNRIEQRNHIDVVSPNGEGRNVSRSEHFPQRVMLSVHDGIVLVGSDAHYWPGPATLMHRAFVKFARELKPRAIILNGDVIDAPQISRHPPIGWEHRPKLSDEIENAQDRLHEITEAGGKAQRVWNLGNHDCLDDKTECLTRRGWLKHIDLLQSDEILSFVDGNAVWSSINEVVRFPFEGDLVRVEKNSFSMAVTGNHRIPLWRLNYRTGSFDIFEYRRADDLPYGFSVPMSGRSVQEDIELSDDQIALAGWILTDGGINKYNISIYQSKEAGIKVIEKLLERLGIEYSRYERQREPRIICGREPKSKPLKAVHFSFRAKSTKKIKEWLPRKGRLPEWAMRLSQRQFGIFLDAVVAGDGVWDGNVEAKGCCVIYGTWDFLSDLQAVAISHGWRARLATDNRGTFRLCLARAHKLRINRPHVLREKYAGIVWCLRVPHENFMVRRNGTAYFTGNSRFSTNIATRAPEYANIKGVRLKDHFPLWESAWSTWINEDVVVKHRFKGGIHAIHNNVLWAGKTMITGHLHSAAVRPFTDYNGTRYGVDTGCLAEPYAKAFNDYSEDNALNWRSAFCVLRFRGGKLMLPDLVLKWDDENVQYQGDIIKP
jgi:LAGLIDADG-like domain